MDENGLQKSINELTKAEKKLYDKAKKGDKDALRAFETALPKLRKLWSRTWWTSCASTS